jgi:hypothetical protein
MNVLLTLNALLVFSFSRYRLIWGVYSFLFLIIFMNLLGMSRPTLFPNVVLFVSLLPAFRKNLGLFRSNSKLFSVATLLTLLVLSTLLNGYTVFNDFFSGVYFGGLLFGIVAPVVINSFDKFRNVLILIWLCILAKTLRISFFFIDELRSLGIENRMMSVESHNNDEALLDPNYFSFEMSLGVLITMLFIFFYKHLFNNKFHIKYGIIIKFMLLSIAILQSYVSLIGLSRSALLFYFLLFIFFAWMILRAFSFKYLLLLATGILFYLYLNIDLVQSYMDRLDSTSLVEEDRMGLVQSIIIITSTNFINLIFGNGVGFEYWKYLWNGQGEYYSTHNSFMTFLLYGGIMFLFVYLGYFVRLIRENIKHINVVSIFKVASVIWILLWSLTLEPISTFFPFWVIFALIGIDSKMILNESKK